MQLELLWTDICFLSLLALGLVLVLLGLRKTRIRNKYKEIIHQGRGLCSGIILLFFLFIGVLDSIHMQVEKGKANSDETLTQIVSVLDRILAPLGQSYEKTYSAPLSLTLFNKEVTLVDGKIRQAFPPLKYTKDFSNKAERNAFIWATAQKAFLLSLAFVGAFLLLNYLLSLRERKGGQERPLLTKKRRIAKWSGYVTFFLALFFVIAAFCLSRHLHLLGTGKIGEDVFYYAIKSIRTGLIIGTLTTFFLLPLALILGIGAGFFGGVIDDVIQYIYTVLSSIPGVLLITASVLSMQTYIANHPNQFPTLEKAADARLLALCLILGITSWTSLCRLLRAETLKLREIDFLKAAQALGSSTIYVFQKHLVPNVMPIVLITVVLDFSFLILAEAVLSYVGVGVSPMTISWGNMINGARLELAADPIIWWPMFAAFVFMFLLVLASNIFADTVRDVFEP